MQFPRLDGVEQMLVSFPDVVSGGFTVVRHDEDGELRSHFGFVLNAGDPHPCTTGYVPTSSTPSPGAVAALDADAVECEVVNGVDPNPGDAYDENGSNIRGEQNIGRDGGRGTTTPEEEVTGHGPVSQAMLDDLLTSLLNASPL